MWKKIAVMAGIISFFSSPCIFATPASDDMWEKPEKHISRESKPKRIHREKKDITKKEKDEGTKSPTHPTKPSVPPVKPAPPPQKPEVPPEKQKPNPAKKTPPVPTESIPAPSEDTHGTAKQPQPQNPILPEKNPATPNTFVKKEQPQSQKAKEKLKVVINLASRSLSVYENGEKTHLFPVGPGKSSSPTPTGYYKIVEKEKNPEWVDPSNPKRVIPSGAENPLGYRWMGLFGTYGIHGTNKPSSIGHFVSSGCIRMQEKDAETLFDMVEIGTPVEITYNRVVVEKLKDSTVVYYIYPDGYKRQPLKTDDVKKWLDGYGIGDFEPQENIVKKIKLSDGEPTRLGKVYSVAIDGEKSPVSAVVIGAVAYFPVKELAKAIGVEVLWDAEQKLLRSEYGCAVGYEKGGGLYCNGEDLPNLLCLDGGIGKSRIYNLSKISPPQDMTNSSGEKKTRPSDFIGKRRVPGR